MNLIDKLRELNACNDAIKFAEGKTLEQAWAECDRGDWMLWLYAKSNNKDIRKLTLTKGYCAQLAIPHMKDSRSIDAVYAAINYGNGHISYNQLRDAADAAYAAADAAYAAADADADVADVAAYAASFAADAAAYASFASAYASFAASFAAARKDTLKKCADICRKHLPIPII